MGLAALGIYYVGEKLVNLIEDAIDDTPDAPSNIDDADDAEEQPDIKVPNVKYPGDDSTVPPGEDYEWKGRQPKGGDKGTWVNNKTGEQFHPDLNHKPPKGPHYDYIDIYGNKRDLFKEGIDPNSRR